MADYDYIIVGGGTAGCVLAARLSEDRAIRVLLLEAGGNGRSPFIRMPAANGFLFGRPEFDWGYESVAQDELGGRRIYYPRGRGLGGTSAINGMIYIRGHPRDYDGWRQLGLDGWAYADVVPYFERAEGGRAGGNGPLRRGPSASYGTLDRRFVEAARQAGLPANPDFNAGDQRGVGVFDVTVDGGQRCSAARAYLMPAMNRANLVVLTGATALGLLLEGRQARGVRVKRDGKVETLRAEREVIVALGAFATPQLLMLSGIGPAGELGRHGLPVVADLPGVGENLQDHFNVPVQYACLDPGLTLARYQRLDRALWLALRYAVARRGPGAAPFWSTGAFVPLEDDAEVPGLQIFFTGMVVVEDLNSERHRLSPSRLFDINRLGGKLLVRGKRAISGFQVDVNQMHPAARGRIALRSADPGDYPLIDPRFLTSESDRRQAVAAVRTARRIVAQPAFDGIRGAELSPGPAVQDDAAILASVRGILNTGHHPVGTCKMGTAHDPMAVVDATLRVRGIDGLRIVDASVMPVQITGNPTGPIVMMAEKASDMILGRPPLPRANEVRLP